MQKWLLGRLFDSHSQDAPHFAFQGTVNWMRALAISIDADGFDSNSLNSFYCEVSEGQPSDALVFENVLLAFNHLAGLTSILDIENPYDACRPAILAWYHTIHSSIVAMVAAAEGSLPDSDEELKSAWHSALVGQQLVQSPFDMSLPTLIKSVCDTQIEGLRGANEFDLNRRPTTAEQAFGGLVSYLNGTAGYQREHFESLVKKTPEFEALGVDNFRKRVAQEVRDSFLAKGFVNFLVQAHRFVGKASYRDSIFLSYGEDKGEEIEQFLLDLDSVATAFFSMSCAYCSRRVGKNDWNLFVDDVSANSRLSLNTDLLMGQGRETHMP